MDDTVVFEPEKLTQLGRSMIAEEDSNCHGVERLVFKSVDTPPVAYTYLGQFIDHDLTRDNTPLGEAISMVPHKTLNLGGGRLDLSQIYGEGPRSRKDGHLFDSGGAFRLGGIVSPINRVQFDVPFSREEPLVADDRTPQNMILRQIAVLFMRLHNIALGKLCSFDQARQLVTWQYQWLIRQDFMSKVLDEDVRSQITNLKTPSWIDWGSTGFSIPIEFSQAAFRFGHSMVRECYRLNSHPVFPLTRVFSSHQQVKPLIMEEAINWAILTSERRQPAEPIDTTITIPLFHLSPDQFHHKHLPTGQPLPHELAVRTLLRGAATRLPTGQDVATALGQEHLSVPANYEASQSLQKLRDLGWEGQTPLWYALLLEAEIKSDGNQLGPLGSLLVGQILEDSMRTDKNSYIYNKTDDTWQLPVWDSPYVSTTISDLYDAAAVAGLDRE
ncbi:MAG TPA: peroxidase family protein [Chthoniobacterales bacterium]